MPLLMQTKLSKYLVHRAVSKTNKSDRAFPMISFCGNQCDDPGHEFVLILATVYNGVGMSVRCTGLPVVPDDQNSETKKKTRN